VDGTEMKIPKILLLILLVVLIHKTSFVPITSAVQGLYRDYDTFIVAFKSLANAYPALATYETIGRTAQNRDIIMFKIGNPTGGRVLFDGAIHGEESLSGELLYFYAKWLLTSNDLLANKILTKCCTLLIPALNPDTYNKCRRNANGVDLNRNFATNWAHAGSPNPDRWDYRGLAPLSEPESQAMVKVFLDLKPQIYVNLHHGGGQGLVGSVYGSRPYYSLLFNKIASLSRELGNPTCPLLKDYFLSGAGFAISDAARAGVASFLLELGNWDPIIPFSEIETVILPRFIPIAAGLSLECKKGFEDSFESGGFSAWDGVRTTAGETAAVVDMQASISCHGTHSAMFTSNGNGGFEGAYCYKTIPSLSELYARAYFGVAYSGIADDDDRFAFMIFKASNNVVAYAGWRQVGGVVRWSLIIRDGIGWVTAYSASSPSLNQWYYVELHWVGDSTNGRGELNINGELICSIQSRNTAAFSKIDQVSFGLAELYNCGNTVVFGDFLNVYAT